MTNPPSDQYWEQPTFAEAAAPPLTGEVLSAPMVPGMTRVAVTAPSQEEATLRRLRRLLWPIALVVALTAGHAVPVLVVAIVVSLILRRRIWELARQRFAAVRPVVSSTGPGADLR